MKYETDKRIVMTLDAGGTNFVFSAIQGNREVVSPLTLPSNAHDLDKCLATIIHGFTRVKTQLADEPVAISFAFPGPADYPRGIIDDLQNLPGFKGGVALGPMLAEKFNLPIFINNDGDLYAYGEAIAGFLPYINNRLAQAGSPKRYQNLLGVTLGTGFGAGIVRNGELFLGDNSAGAEIFLVRNKLHPQTDVEESASIRGIKRVYIEKTNINPAKCPSPKEIYEIGIGKKAGNRQAAIEAYRHLAIAVGDALANVNTIFDGIIVIGGGISGAHPLFLPAIVDEMNSQYELPDGGHISRLLMRVFNLEDENDLKHFLRGNSKEILVPGTNKKITYDPMKRTGVGISRIGASPAIALGAYAFALNAIDSG